MNLFEKDSNVNLIIKTVGRACNINCQYCFEQAKNVDTHQITPKQLDNIINSVDNKCSVVFHGGEPLIIGIKAFSNLLEVVKKYYPEKVTSIKIQTNGILLNEKWIELIYKKYRDLSIEIAISLDGTKEMNKFRIDKNGINTFSRVIYAFKLLEKYEKKAGLLSVISKPALKYADQYVSLIASIPNVKFVKINALFNVVNNKLTYNSITPSEYAKFINDVARKYISSGLYKKLPIEPILSIIQRINGFKSRYCNYSDRKCFNYLSVYPDGKVGPCDCLSVNEFLIIDIDNENVVSSLEKSINKYILSSNLDELKKIIRVCDRCDIKEFCKGGCISQRYYFRNNEELITDFCKSKHYLYNKFKIYNLNQGEKFKND